MDIVFGSSTPLHGLRTKCPYENSTILDIQQLRITSAYINRKSKTYLILDSFFAMPITCEFQLNNPRATYFTGKTFAGSIILTTTSDKDIRSKFQVAINCGQTATHK